MRAHYPYDAPQCLNEQTEPGQRNGAFSVLYLEFDLQGTCLRCVVDCHGGVGCVY